MGGSVDPAHPAPGTLRQQPSGPVALRLRVLDDEFVLAHQPDVVPDDWLALVRAPEGLTVVGRATSATAATDVWRAFYDAEAEHGLDVPGLLASVTTPLASAGIPVYVLSTYHADLVLVPASRLDDARAALEQAGHLLTR